MKKKVLWKKAVSLLLAGAMMLGGIEPLSLQAAGSDSGTDMSALAAAKVLELKFDNNLTDSSDNALPVTSHGKIGRAHV